MTLRECIRQAEQILPGRAAPEGRTDPRWQAIIAVGEFVEQDPEAVWDFARRWGSYPDPDLRSAVATCLLEHLLEHHFDRIFPEVERAVREDPRFVETVQLCWAMGQVENSANAQRLARLVEAAKRAS
jgi:hypothetical protein